MTVQNTGMRIFRLVREEDESGVSGVGVVAEGVLFSNSKAVISWRTIHKSVCIYDSLAEMIAVHGHNGKTNIVWEGEEEAPKIPAKKTVLDDE